MSLAPAALIRGLAVAIGLAVARGLTATLDPSPGLVPTDPAGSSDAGVVLVGGVLALAAGWAVRDGWRWGFARAVPVWALAATAPAVLAAVVLTATRAGDGALDLLRLGSGVAGLRYALVLVAALVGAGLGDAVRPLPGR